MVTFYLWQMRLVFHLQQRFHSKTNPLEFFKKEKKYLHLRKDINQVQVVTRGHANNYVELRGNTLHPTRCHRLATVCGIPIPSISKTPWRWEDLPFGLGSVGIKEQLTTLILFSAETVFFPPTPSPGKKININKTSWIQLTLDELSVVLQLRS